MAVLRNEGDAVEGERIICFFRKFVGKPIICAGTSRHRGMRVVIDGTPAYCEIARCVRSLQKRL